MAATLFRKVTTLFQHSNVLLRKKLSLWIVPCNITWKELNYAIYTTFVLRNRLRIPLRIMEEILPFHMTSWRPYWCSKTMKRRPCWCTKTILWELNSFLMQTLSFVPINLHRCWPREWKRSIRLSIDEWFEVSSSNANLTKLEISVWHDFNLL